MSEKRDSDGGDSREKNSWLLSCVGTWYAVADCRPDSKEMSP